MLLPPFENFSLDTLNREQKLSVKTGRPGRSETGLPASQPAMILKFTGRVEKILTGSISALPSAIYLAVSNSSLEDLKSQKLLFFQKNH